MQRVKRIWKRLPNTPRRVLTFVVGFTLIIISGLIGWIPGPGGMVPFLLGIAILATEFSWAQRLRDAILARVSEAGQYARKHPLVTLLITIIGISLMVSFLYYILI
jgi:hypothetical protein